MKPFKTWPALNEAVMATTDERRLLAMLKAEQQGPKRPIFIKRIHSRLNKVRADRERRELLP